MRSRCAWLAALSLLLVALPGARGTFAAPAAGTSPPGPPATLVVLGDSISAGYGISVAQGWVALLAHKLTATGYGYRVVNASVSGETTAGALARLAHILELHHPSIVLVELGGNDGLRGLPIAATSANLEQIVSAVQDSGAQAVILGMRLPSNYGPEYTTRFAALYQSVARTRHAPLVPFLLASIAGNDANFQADGIHPTAAVQGELVNTVWPVLEPLLKAAPAPARHP